MKKKVCHIFQVPFTGKTPKGDAMTQEWYDKRADLFIEYTVRSLAGQTRKDFGVWLTFRPQEFISPTTQRIAKALADAKIDYFMTFNGTMFTEDRATWHNENLPERLADCLPKVKSWIGEFDHIYETNLDSDDMVHKNFSELAQSKLFKSRGALYMTKGFAYNTEDRLADWNNPMSQQNYTIMFPAAIYFDAKKRLEYLNGLKTHEEVPEKFDAEKLPDGLYCTVIHGDNISTIWTHPFREKEYFYADEKDAILKNFLCP